VTSYAKGNKTLVQQVIQIQLQRFKNFLGFARHFVRKNLVPEVLFAPVITGLKDFFSLPKKRKMSKYRVDYQMYKLRQMEDLIAKNHDHYFLSGRKINDVR